MAYERWNAGNAALLLIDYLAADYFMVLMRKDNISSTDDVS